jgi:hypothetical protein
VKEQEKSIQTNSWPPMVFSTITTRAQSSKSPHIPRLLRSRRLFGRITSLTSSVNTNTPPIWKAGTTELIAASPFDTIAPGPSERSFTHALITELKALAQEGQMFSVAELHRRVLANIIKQRTGLKRRILKQWLHPSVSPVYVRLFSGAEEPSIGPMPIRVESGMEYPEARS